MGLKKIILDTNFLIYCAENKVDYIAGIDELMTEGYELIVPSQVISELEELSQKSEKFSDRTAAWTALKILKANNIQVASGSGRYADEAILNMVRLGSIVATLDQDLKKEIGKNNRIIVIKGIKKVDFE